MLLTKDMEPEYFHQVFRLRPDLWQESMLELCREKNIPSANFYPFLDGSNLIAAIGDGWILKFFPPFHVHQWISEHRVMQHLDGKLALPIPQFFEAGSVGEGWTFIIMSRLSGVTLDSLWPELSQSNKERIMCDIGAIMAKVHSLPVDGLETLSPLWKDFIPAQLQACQARHQRLGMPAWFVDRIASIACDSLTLLPQNFQTVILTGEYTPFNLLVENSREPDRIVGMIDFGDSVLGFRKYDFLGPLLFLGEGNPELIKSLFSGYGLDAKDVNPELRRRLFVLQLLHRYSDFKGQLKIPRWEERVTTMEELEQLIWPMQL